MNPISKIKALLAILTLHSLSACGMVGDTGSVKDANELAIECRTDEALAAVIKAEEGGGLSSYIADLQKESEKLRESQLAQAKEIEALKAALAAATDGKHALLEPGADAPFKAEAKAEVAASRAAAEAAEAKAASEKGGSNDKNGDAGTGGTKRAHPDADADAGVAEGAAAAGTAASPSAAEAAGAPAAKMAKTDSDAGEPDMGDRNMPPLPMSPVAHQAPLVSAAAPTASPLQIPQNDGAMDGILSP